MVQEPEDHYLQKSVPCSHIGNVINNVINYSGKWGKNVLSELVHNRWTAWRSKLRWKCEFTKKNHTAVQIYKSTII